MKRECYTWCAAVKFCVKYASFSHSRWLFFKLNRNYLFVGAEIEHVHKESHCMRASKSGAVRFLFAAHFLFHLFIHFYFYFPQKNFAMQIFSRKLAQHFIFSSDQNARLAYFCQWDELKMWFGTNICNISRSVYAFWKCRYFHSSPSCTRSVCCLGVRWCIHSLLTACNHDLLAHTAPLWGI